MPRHAKPPRLAERAGHYYFEWRDLELQRTRRVALGVISASEAYPAFTAFARASQNGRALDGKTGARLTEAVKSYNLRQAAAVGDDPTLGQIIDHYLTKKVKPDNVRQAAQAKWSLRLFITKYAHVPASSISATWCEDYTANRMSGLWCAPVKSGTVRRELSTLQAAANFAIKRKILEPSRAPVIELPPAGPPKDRWLRADELKRLFSVAQDSFDFNTGVWRAPLPGERQTRIFRWLALAYFTGARTEAIERLAWDQVDLEHNVIDFNDGGPRTTKRRAVVRMDKQLVPIIQRAHEERLPGPYVLDEPGSIRRALRTATKRAGLEGVTRHTLRHTRATTLLRKGVPPMQVAALLGHTVQTLLTNYAHAMPAELPEDSL